MNSRHVSLVLGISGGRIEGFSNFQNFLMFVLLVLILLLTLLVFGRGVVGACFRTQKSTSEGSVNQDLLFRNFALAAGI